MPSEAYTFFCTAEEGMTWAEWIESEYNDGPEIPSSEVIRYARLISVIDFLPRLRTQLITASGEERCVVVCCDRSSFRSGENIIYITETPACVVACRNETKYTPVNANSTIGSSEQYFIAIYDD